MLALLVMPVQVVKICFLTNVGIFVAFFCILRELNMEAAPVVRNHATLQEAASSSYYSYIRLKAI